MEYLLLTVGRGRGVLEFFFIFHSSMTPNVAMLCPGHLIDARELVLLYVYLTLIKSSVDFQFEFYLGGTELKKSRFSFIIGLRDEARRWQRLNHNDEI